MTNWMYYLLDVFFIIFHTLLILFNLFGWIWKRTRKWNFLTLNLTAFSWFILGIWYGWGYCFCTDWHWQVRQHLGKHITEQSYITFLIHQFSDVSLSQQLVDAVTLVAFLLAYCISLAYRIKIFR